MSARVAMIALDSIEASVVRRGVEEGWLPTFSALLREGSGARLRNSRWVFPGSCWPTTITGHLPEDHLAIFDRQLAPGSDKFEDLSAERIRRPPFWRAISDAGLRSTITSVYANHILPDFRGTQVASFGCYDPFSTKLQAPSSEPPEVLDMLRRAAPGKRSGFLPALPRTERQLRWYGRHILKQVRLQTKVLSTLMQRTEWDFFFGSYSESHEAGHLLWHLHDPASPAYIPPGRRDSDPLKDVYVELDRGLDVLLSTCPDDVVFKVLTPMGMGPHDHTFLATEELLKSGGWLSKADTIASADGVRQAISRFKAMVPLSLRWAIGKHRSLERHSVGESFPGVDWTKTSAYSLIHDQNSAIRLNLAGREPHGSVPRERYDDAMRDIERAMRELQALPAGRPAVQDVLFVRDEVGRPVEQVLPDVLVVWNKLYARKLSSERLGEVTVPRDDPRTGDHRPDGFLISVGPGVASGGDAFEGRVNDLIDIAPTILDQLGIGSSGDLPGRPITTD